MRLRFVRQVLVDTVVYGADTVADIDPEVAARLLADGDAERVGDVDQGPVRTTTVDQGPVRTAARRPRKGG